MAPDEEMLALRQKLSGLAERIARGFKLDLDYSEKSVDRVEKVLAAMHAAERRSVILLHMRVPTAFDINVYDSLEERSACEHFLGKNIEQA